MTLTYYQIGFTVWITTFSILSLLCLLVQLVIKSLVAQSIRLASESSGDFDVQVSNLTVSRWVRVIRVLSVWGCPIFFTLGIISLSIFDILVWYAVAIICVLLLLIYWAYYTDLLYLVYSVCGRKTAKKEYYETLLDGDDIYESDSMHDTSLGPRQFNAKSKLFSVIVRQGIPLIIVSLLLFGFCWFSSSVCITVEPISISSKGMRALSNDPCANSKSACHVYLNVGANTSSSMVVVFQTSRRFGSPLVWLDTAPGPAYTWSFASKEIVIKHLEVQRYVYVTYLGSLSPDTTYYFATSDGGNNATFSQERKFRTTHANLSPTIATSTSSTSKSSSKSSTTTSSSTSFGNEDITIQKNIKFVSGGDVGTSDAAINMLKIMAKYDPDLALIGGDIAYANAIPACYRRWDSWFNLWEKYALTPTGYSIPMLTSIGNHEAGGFTLNKNKSPFYMNYFFHEPFDVSSFEDYKKDAIVKQKSSKRDDFKQIDELPTYHAHDIGGSLIVVLDSGVVANPDGDQALFLKDTLSDSKSSKFSMALYHAPLYPSVRDFNNKLSKQLRESWVWLFDKYHLDIAFENHDHAFKRSYPLKANQPVSPDKGTVYLGDGSMGAKPRSPGSIHKRDYLVKAEAETFFFYMVLSDCNITMKAIDDVQDELDYYVFYPKKKI